jgi:hypothetical protein
VLFVRQPDGQGRHGKRSRQCSGVKISRAAAGPPAGWADGPLADHMKDSCGWISALVTDLEPKAIAYVGWA